MFRRPSPFAGPRLLFALSLSLSLGACDGRVELHAGLSEGDANAIVAALLSNGVHGDKQAAKAGFVVSVGESELAAAVALLHERGLPRRGFARMGEVFKKDGMISSPVEERARYLSALAQELESTLSQIDGVVLARVHPVLSERIAPGEAMQPSSCAVLIKYRPGWEPDAYEARIRRLVLTSIPGLATSPGSPANKVSVIFVPATPADDGATGGRSGPAAASRGKGGAVAYALFALAASLACGALCWYFWRARLLALYGKWRPGKV